MRGLLTFLSLAMLVAIANAAECTNSEATYSDSLWDAAAASSACSAYVTQINPVYIDAPCTATSCVSYMESVAENLPGCTYSGVSNKIELQNALTACNGGDTANAGPPTTVTDAPDTSTSTTTTTNTTPTPTSSSTTDCTADEYQSTEDLYNAAAASSACSPYSTSSSLLVTFYTPCSATDCVAVLTQLASDLPDCLYDGANQKTELTDNLSICTDDTTGKVDSSTPVSTSSGSTSTTSPTPASTASSTGCTTTEVNDMWDLYVSTAESDECADDSTVNGYSVYIFTSCSSDCADKIKDLAEALPNCYYDYEFMNKKQDVLEELDDCEESSNYYISVTLYPDSTIESASSSAPSGVSDSEPLVSGGDPADTTLDASTVGQVGQSAVPPLVSAGLLRRTAIASLLMGAILAF
ncbi:elicitin-like protein SOL13A [Phytophthora cinnamomi]|uniref:elicitin-like protein SOL13A n=1 Tax=Phytophthora cinnamomi TaxID=4785 RepID=UPI00355A7A68|nr:elicitin-like protein SOL13A [Phytophthora cinnamomi]